ncbi:hypothetical protein [Anaerocolumna sp. MB42-C2]|uniref:hypothetical protein n=1 Tax=Anaerocolumna sp. MB42-C2 TaxID=3070997 RepID=UPI0027DFA07E|nr:hypothetical protein [Anaerocolumna sp. MB42-C2]WMJ86764.1 hypothetical protein RBU59_22395 [Anaerocolumna sp. MB42-C2]
MSILTELISYFNNLQIPVETGVFSDTAPDVYVVITPIANTFGYFADNRPNFDVQEARISLFSKGNYQQTNTHIVVDLIELDFTLTDRRYLGYENDTGYHHVAIDVEKYYGLEE